MLLSVAIKATESNNPVACCFLLRKKQQATTATIENSLKTHFFKWKVSGPY